MSKLGYYSDLICARVCVCGGVMHTTAKGPVTSQSAFDTHTRSPCVLFETTDNHFCICEVC